MSVDLRHTVENKMALVEMFVGDSVAFYRIPNRAARIGILMVITEFTDVQIIPEFNETADNKFWRQMSQIKFHTPGKLIK